MEIKKSIAAGMLIGFGCTVYLSCEKQIVGAALFSVGLLLICLLDLNLYTGKVGYIFEQPRRSRCFTIWCGNLIGIACVSVLVRAARPQVHRAAVDLIARKFELPVATLAILAFLCGMVMHLSVENYMRQKNSVGGIAGIVLCVIVFIVCGFEHSIADMGYCILAVRTVRELFIALGFVATVSVCNGLGAVVMNEALKLGGEKND